MMKYVYCLLALVIGCSNFGYAWFAPVEYFWQTMMLTMVIFAASFGQFAFAKPGEESAVFFLQIASMGFLLLGFGNLAIIA